MLEFSAIQFIFPYQSFIEESMKISAEGDQGTFFFLLFVGFKVEADIRINKSSDPFRSF